MMRAMMNWWRQRQARKQGRHLVKGTRKLLRMHRDLLDPHQVEELRQAADALAEALRARDTGAVAGATEKLETRLGKAFPPQKHAAWRENVEVFLVAAIVAMGVRTFFFQPFKIPTGSMQPTLYGIVPASDCDHRANIFRRFYEGAVLGIWPQRPEGSLLSSLNDFVAWAVFQQWPVGRDCVFSGDHIFVDRFTYHFRKPQRGDVVVFATGFMRDRGVDPRGSFYIKRCAAIGGDHVEITPPYLRVNGEILDDRPAFQRIYSRANGYHGYQLPPPQGFPYPPRYLNTLQPSYDVPADSVLALGDNTTSSLDSRYWGAVPADAVIGRALFVYWPFSKRFGPIN
jgi:signal peptidase I